MSSHLVHLESQQWILLTGDHHHGVGPGDGGPEQRDEAEERRLVRTGHADDPDWLVYLDDGP